MRRLQGERDDCLISKKMNRKKKFMILKEIVQDAEFWMLKALLQRLSKLRFAKTAKKGSLLLREDGRMGLASQMTFRCVECGDEPNFNSDFKTGWFFPVNRSAVFASKLIGRGYAALSKVCNTLDIPGPMAKRTYEKHSKNIRDAAVMEAKESMRAAVQEIREINNCGEDELADIANY